VQTTLDKIFSQVELVSHTLHLLEKRIAYSEDRMGDVMNFIKDGDVLVRPRLVQGYPQFNQAQSSLLMSQQHEDVGSEHLGYIVRPMENMNINTGGAPTQSDEANSSPKSVGGGFKRTIGGEDYYRNTNVFEQQNQHQQQL
jgi:hypothetical protein